jgi:hypothetical protein
MNVRDALNRLIEVKSLLVIMQDGGETLACQALDELNPIISDIQEFIRATSINPDDLFIGIGQPSSHL